MSVLVDKNTRLIVQGITGREGSYHAKGCAEYSKQFGNDIVVGGVTPGKGGTTHEGWPVFNTVEEAVAATGKLIADTLSADKANELIDAAIKDLPNRLH